MNEILHYPAYAYDWIYGNYGTVGLIFTALMLIYMFLFCWHWYEGRK